VKINVDDNYQTEQFIQWMNENVGVFNDEWKWFSNPTDWGVSIKDQNKAIFVALRWGCDD
jgi:hypothetical protein